MTEFTQKLDAFEATLAPLVDVALWNGVSVNDVQRMLRRLFVDRAAHQLRERGEPVTTARVAIASGANRNEVAAILQQSGAREAERTTGARLRARIPELLSVWTIDPRFSGPYGAARNLYVGASIPGDEDGVSFSALTEAVDPRIDPNEAAEMLVQAGCASWVDDRRRVLGFEKVTFIPGPEAASDTHFLQGMRVLAGMAGTIAHNLNPTERKEPLLQRAVIADHPLAPSEATVLQEYAESNFGAALSQADQFFAALPPAVGQRGRRFGIGVFVFEDRPYITPSASSFVEPDQSPAVHAEG